MSEAVQCFEATASSWFAYQRATRCGRLEAIIQAQAEAEEFGVVGFHPIVHGLATVAP